MIRKFFYYPLIIFFSLSIAQFSSSVILGQADTVQNQDSVALADFLAQMQKEDNSPSTTITQLDERIDAIKTVLNELFSIISALSQMIHENQITSLENKREALKNLFELSSLVQQYQDEKFLNCDIESCANILKLIHALINHMNNALDNGLKSIDKFDVQSFVLSLLKRSNIPQSIQFVDAEISKTLRGMNLLKKKADNAGLAWYNHIYRALDSTVIAPSIKYNIPLKASIIGTGIFSSLYFWWRFNHESFKEHTEPLGIYKFFGPDPRNDQEPMNNPRGERTTGAAPFAVLGPIAKVDRILYDFYRDGSTLNKLSLGVFFAGVVYEYSKWHSWLKKNIQIAHNTLKGGIYLKEAFRHAGSVETVRFADIVGNEEAKEYFTGLINYLENPESYDRLGLTPQKGCLLFGETGTGKTLMVNALYNELELMLAKNGMSQKVKFLRINVDHINKHGIKNLFEDIKQFAPCIVFIDEIDLIDLQRRGKNDNLSELLQNMSGVFDNKDPKNQVIIIAATNQPESLDKALLREGRFGKQLLFEYPSVENKITFIKSKIEKLSLDTNKFDIEKIALQTAGKSYEFLKTVINEAVIYSRKQKHSLCQEDIEFILDNLLRKIINVSNVAISEREKNIIAAHFSGHTVALKLFPSATKTSRVTIKPVMSKIREEFMGIHLFKDEKEANQKRVEHGGIFTSNSSTTDMFTREEQINLCKFYLAGVTAEEVLLGSSGHKCHVQDKNEAFEIAMHLVTEGLALKLMPEELKTAYFKKAELLLKQYKKELNDLFIKNKDKLTRVYTALLEKETLAEEEVDTLFQPVDEQSTSK